MTPAEITAQLAARGWTPVGAPIQNTAGTSNWRLYAHTTHQSRQPLLVLDDSGELRVFREVPPERLEMILAGGGPPR
jgi:hypothetical protein